MIGIEHFDFLDLRQPDDQSDVACGKIEPFGFALIPSERLWAGSVFFVTIAVFSGGRSELLERFLQRQNRVLGDCNIELIPQAPQRRLIRACPVRDFKLNQRFDYLCSQLMGAIGSNVEPPDLRPSYFEG